MLGETSSSVTVAIILMDLEFLENDIKQRSFVQFSAMWVMNIQAQKVPIALNSHWEIHIQCRAHHRETNGTTTILFTVLPLIFILSLYPHPLLLLERWQRRKIRRKCYNLLSRRCCFCLPTCPSSETSTSKVAWHWQGLSTPLIGAVLKRKHIQIRCRTFQAPSLFLMCQSTL